MGLTLVYLSVCWRDAENFIAGSQESSERSERSVLLFPCVLLWKPEDAIDSDGSWLAPLYRAIPDPVIVFDCVPIFEADLSGRSGRCLLASWRQRIASLEPLEVMAATVSVTFLHFVAAVKGA